MLSSGKITRGSWTSGLSFTNAGGLDLKVGAEGVQLGGEHSNRSCPPASRLPSRRKSICSRSRSPDGQTFVLYAGFYEAHKPKFNPTLPYLQLFAGSREFLLSIEAAFET
jgi:hypothetical protein